MAPEAALIETLRRWSQILLWLSVVLPVLGALAGGIRFYVERQEKQLSATMTAAAINRAADEAVRARSDLANLEQKTLPRTILPEQKRSLSADLQPDLETDGATIGKVVVTAATGNQEAQNYAMQFVKTFRAVGFESDLSLPIPGLRPDIIGIHLGVRDPTNIPASVLVLSGVLQKAGIQFTISPIEPDFFPGADFVFVVGAK